MTTALGNLAPERANHRERLFYLFMALTCAAVAMLGFGGYLVLGFSSFHSPWWVHVHAVTFVGWLGLYVLQNFLIVRGATYAHRRMGVFMTGWAGWMVIVGLTTSMLNTISHRTPAAITPPILTAIDTACLGTFAALLGAGLLLRGRSDWHRRLILCANIALIAPGVDRIADLGIPHSPPAMFIHLTLAAGAIVFDLFNRRTVHPALVIGTAAIATMCLAVGPLASLPALVDFTKTLGGR